ncbi:antibiotic biosynthesis monooxygenase [Streptomyces albus subsp. chlorinus]|uniref:antibiotic biosynthesis monooxygenase family protein n=1 Tax=Streptomyces albus TaxID=1888 RepID=UPI00157109F4|nr:antibiotic biosynthesis monooxygenase [Streptomyces albus]NSC21564.1 antibiotic biosynthesis monooxygenase [Streptomyces albus subsp. chlorinus]
MKGEVRVLLYHSTEDEAGIRAAYHEVSSRMAGVPGLLGNELLRSDHDSRQFLVISRWASREDFDRWEQGAQHKGQTAPLRPYRDTGMARPFGVYTVDAAYTEESTADPRSA